MREILRGLISGAFFSAVAEWSSLSDLRYASGRISDECFRTRLV